MQANTTISVTEVENRQLLMLWPAILYTSLLMLMGAVGNSVVCYIYGFRWQSTVTKIFIFSLAALDLLNSLICMPTEISMLVKIVTFDAPYWCKITRFLTYTLNGSSSLILVAIALDRWYKVCRPLKCFFTHRRAKWTCCAAIIFASGISWPSFILYGNLSVPITHTGVMGVTCLVSDEFIDTWWPLVFYCMYFMCYLCLVVAIVVLYSMIAVKLVELKKQQRERLTARYTGLRSSKLMYASQDTINMASHYDDNASNVVHTNCAIKIQVDTEHEEYPGQKSSPKQHHPQLQRVYDDSERRRSVTFRLPLKSTDSETAASEDSCAKDSNKVQIQNSVCFSDVGNKGERSNDSNTGVASVKGHSNVYPSSNDHNDHNTKKPSNQVDYCEPGTPNHNHTQHSSNDCNILTTSNDGESVTQTSRDPSKIKISIHPDDTFAQASGDCENSVETGGGEDLSLVDALILAQDEDEAEMTRSNESLHSLPDNAMLLTPLASDTTLDDNDDFEHGIHFTADTSLSWQHNPIVDPATIFRRHDVSVDEALDDVKDVSANVTVDEIGSSNSLLDSKTKQDKTKLDITKQGKMKRDKRKKSKQDKTKKDKMKQGQNKQDIMNQYIAKQDKSNQDKTRLNKTKQTVVKTRSDTSALSTSQRSTNNQTLHKTNSDSNLVVPGKRHSLTSARRSFLMPCDGYPGGHTPTSRLPTPTDTPLPNHIDSRPVMLSSKLLVEKLNKKMAYRPAKTTRMLFAISIVFVVSFFPFFCIVIARAAQGRAFFATLSDVGVVVISIFIRSSFLSNAANPIIYGLCNKQFRTECRHLFRHCSGKKRDVRLRVIEATDDVLGSHS